MSELLFELFCEEIPAGMQAKASADLEKAVVTSLADAGLKGASVQSFYGARRLTLVIDGLPEKGEDVVEERKGPRVGAPEQALQGFLRSAGLSSIDECAIESTKKGDVYIARIEKPGRQTAEVIAEAIPAILKGFHWPKSMRIGEGEKTQRWVRPIQRFLCLFGGEVVDFEVFGIKAGDETEGHRVLGRGPFKVSDFASYRAVLEGEGHVLLDAEARKQIIMDGARKLCAEAGLELVEDAGLLNEVAGLVEYPVPLLGEMDPAFLDLPPEVVRLTMKTHQKYFAVRKPGEDGLAPNFIVIANQTAPDGGKAIAAGNQRVLSARLSDAEHFWDNDHKTPLSEMATGLEKVTFHEKLGTVADKVERVAALARELAAVTGADPDLAERAARLAKADLVSEMVYEFPELQGVMGRYYALKQGEDARVADAIRDHYKPQGPSDAVPTEPVAAAVALADKLDTLVGFWAIDEKPTGSKDPFALRRAALGVIRSCLSASLRLQLTVLLSQHLSSRICYPNQDGVLLVWGYDPDSKCSDLSKGVISAPLTTVSNPEECAEDLLAFFADRLKVHLRDEGVRHDVIDAVFALGDDDLVRVTHRARALQAFLDTDDGAALLAGYRRAANILKAEEKKDGETYEGEPSYGSAELQAEERALVEALAEVRPAAEAAVQAEDFNAAMAALAKLRAPVDAFFDKVTVNAEDAALRRNRLLLLSTIRSGVRAVADFDRLEG